MPNHHPPIAATKGRSRRLQTRVGLALGTLMFVLSLLLAAVLGKTAETHIAQLSAVNLENLSDHIAGELSEGMSQFSREVVNQTRHRVFEDRTSRPDEMRAALDRFKADNPEFAYVSIVDVATARVLAAGGGIFEGGDARGRPTFEEGRKGPYLGDVHDAARLAELLPRPPTKEPLRFLDVAAPITDASGTVYRVFAAHVAWEWTAQVRDRIIGPAKDRRGVEAFLVDTRGKVVLAGSPGVPVGTDLSPIVGQKGKAAVRTTWADEQDYLTSVAEVRPRGPFPGFGWRVVARQPFETALAPVRNLQYAFLIGGLLLGLGAAGLAWFVGGRLVRPVSLLAEGAATTRKQFEILAESLPQVVWQADARGRLEYVNKDWVVAHQPAGRPRVEDLAHWISPGDRDEFLQAWRHSLGSAAPLDVRCRLRTPEHGAERWFDLQASAVRDDDRTTLRWVGTIFDVHEMVTLSEATKRALAEERGARADAERLARMRDEFLATVSHELRSPLSAINGWSEILLRKGSADPMIAKAGEVIRRNSAMQATLINDLLDMTAVLGGKMLLAREPVDVSRIAREVVVSQLHAAQAKGVDLSRRDDMPVMVNADPRRLTQVLSNVVGNAIKFTPAGGRVDVLMTIRDGQACLRVKDTGRGISAEFLPHVFDRMRQEDASATRNAGGLGLGLAVARGIVELHQGTITAESDGPGRGTLITVCLPLSGMDAEFAPSAAGEDDTLAAGTNLRGTSILVVDDEQDAREVTQVALASLGAHVRLASSALEALQFLARERFDVLVSDIGMPDMDGLTLLRRIRALPNGSARQLPAVALSAFAMETDVRAGMQAGFQAYVAKPISIGPLAQAISVARETTQ